MSDFIVNEKELEVPEEIVDTPEEEVVVEVEDNLPEKFKGKSAAEIAESYMNVEKEKSRIANELGELRKFTDQVLELKTQESIVEETPEEIDPDTLWQEPDRVISDKINQSPTVKRMEERVNELETSLALKDFETRHPDYRDITKDEEFLEWVKASPYRVRQFQAADRFDLDAGDELFSSWKERKEFQTVKASAKENLSKKEEIKKQGLETGAGGANTGKKIFRRVDLIKLRMEDPDRYSDPAFQAEIKAAYVEGRVR